MLKLTGVEHDLKIWPPYFHAVATDLKPWEFRQDDRGYRVGDVLNLREWDPRTQTYTGRACRRVVTFILHGGFRIPDGYVIMSMAHVPMKNAPPIPVRELIFILIAAVMCAIMAWWKK